LFRQAGANPKGVSLKLAYSYEEAAAALGISAKVLRNAVRDNELVATYVTTRKPVFRAADLEQWLDSKPTERPDQAGRS
jgi:excisionase family DNA binding protein